MIDIKGVWHRAVGTKIMATTLDRADKQKSHYVAFIEYSVDLNSIRIRIKQQKSQRWTQTKGKWKNLLVSWIKSLLVERNEWKMKKEPSSVECHRVVFFRSRLIVWRVIIYQSRWWKISGEKIARKCETNWAHSTLLYCMCSGSFISAFLWIQIWNEWVRIIERRLASKHIETRMMS